MKRRDAILRLVLLASLFTATRAVAQDKIIQDKIILDTDFNTIQDDGQAFVVMAQEQAAGHIQLLGITVCSGNSWRDQEVSDALRAVERMGLSGSVGVHLGADMPLMHDPQTYAAERSLYGAGYAGAFGKPKPRSQADLVMPPDGWAQTKPDPQGAVEFIVDQVKKYPHQVTILAIAPLTNLALAFRSHPEIVPLVKRIIYMGGDIKRPGSATASAEFNWWFDPDAARIVLREPIEGVIIPDDAGIPLPHKVVDEIAQKNTGVGPMFAQYFRARWAKDPAYVGHPWDTLAAAYAVRPELAKTSEDLWVDVDAQFGPDYGRALAYESDPPVGAQRFKVIFAFDEKAFWSSFEGWMTGSIPIAGKK